MTYVAPSEDRSYRRQQRRRALVGWAFGLLIVGGTILAGIAGGSGGGNDGPGGLRPGNFTAHDMTQRQFDGLQDGLEEGVFVNRLQKVGLPENLAPAHYVELFPAPASDVQCSFWEISDTPEHIARICFSSPAGRLVEKEETYAGDRNSEVEAAPA